MLMLVLLVEGPHFENHYGGEMENTGGRGEEWLDGGHDSSCWYSLKVSGLSLSLGGIVNLFSGWSEIAP